MRLNLWEKNTRNVSESHWTVRKKHWNCEGKTPNLWGKNTELVRKKHRTCEEKTPNCEEKTLNLWGKISEIYFENLTVLFNHIGILNFFAFKIWFQKNYPQFSNRPLVVVFIYILLPYLVLSLLVYGWHFYYSCFWVSVIYFIRI